MRQEKIINIIKNALYEDAASKDITTSALIPVNLRVLAEIIAKDSGVVSGLGVAKAAFRLLDKNIKFSAKAKDGTKIKNGVVLAQIRGQARSILSAERVALNFLAHLSGIATLTRQLVEKVKPYKVKILDTRKTTPNLRLLERYAVRCGGGVNHRFNLSDQVLIKDNHVVVSSIPPCGRIGKYQVSSLDKLVEKAREKAKGKKIEIEVDNLRQFKEALVARPDVIMLDNFKISDIKKAVRIRNSILNTPAYRTGRQYSIPRIEASGGITLRNIRQVAATGVDFISIGALTHSVKSLDLSLEIIG